MTVERPDPTRVVADADVLVADLLVGGAAREALDLVRSHSWTTLVASDELLTVAATVIADLADEGLAADWRERLEAIRLQVEHAADDHPALASALQGNAAHLLTFDEQLASAETGAALRPYGDVSVKPPDGFVRLFDPAQLYPALFDDPYPGPDRNPRD